MQVFFHSLPTAARATERLTALKAWGCLKEVSWLELTPDEKGNWLTEGMVADFETYLPLGTKEAKRRRKWASDIHNLLAGRAENRDEWFTT